MAAAVECSVPEARGVPLELVVVVVSGIAQLGGPRRRGRRPGRAVELVAPDEHVGGLFVVARAMVYASEFTRRRERSCREEAPQCARPRGGRAGRAVPSRPCESVGASRTWEGWSAARAPRSLRPSSETVVVRREVEPVLDCEHGEQLLDLARLAELRRAEPPGIVGQLIRAAWLAAGRIGHGRTVLCIRLSPGGVAQRSGSGLLIYRSRFHPSAPIKVGFCLSETAGRDRRWAST